MRIAMAASPKKVLLALAGIAAPLLASGAPKIELAYTAPAGCPNKGDVEQEIAGFLAQSSVPSVRASIVITATASGHRARIGTTIGGNKGERVLDANTCEEAAHAAALVVALAVDPVALTTPSASASASASTSTSASASASVSSTASAQPSISATPLPVVAPPPSATPPKPAVVATTPVAFVVSAGGALDTSALPGAAFGVAAQLGIEVGRIRLAGGFIGLPSKTASVSGRDAGGSFSLLAGSTIGCFRALEFLAPCAAFELGRMSASGVNVRTPRTDHALWKAALAGLAIPLRRGVLGVRPEAWIVIPIAMPDFVLDDVGTVHSPHVGVRASLSVELTIF